VRRSLQKLEYLRWGSHNWNTLLDAYESFGKGILVEMKAKYGKP
jgi:hypothetical protein